jgi:hypothetical protein
MSQSLAGRLTTEVRNRQKSGKEPTIKEHDLFTQVLDDLLIPGLAKFGVEIMGKGAGYLFEEIGSLISGILLL